jgi:predicted RNase H-like nuclease (RuvC/YqgF family)
MTDIVNRLDWWREDDESPFNAVPIMTGAHGTSLREDIAADTEEIETLRERCEAYKGQVEAGAKEIERLKAERDDYRDCAETTAKFSEVKIEAMTKEIGRLRAAIDQA